MYNEKPQIKLYAYENGFVLKAIIDDYESCSFERNMYEAGQFTITINYNIPNALLFSRGLWVQFGNDEYDFGEISSITDSIGENGKESQKRQIVGYDARYIFKRRIIMNFNEDSSFSMTDTGEAVMRELISYQCGENAETKRQLPVINVAGDTTIGSEYSIEESYSNLYEVLVTIATQSEIGWRLKFDGELTLEFYAGTNRRQTVFFTTEMDSLKSGTIDDTSDSYCNTVYVGGQGTGSDRDIYESEAVSYTGFLLANNGYLIIDDYKGKLAISDAEYPESIDRFEAFDDQSSMTTETEYKNEALSMLAQYGQTVTFEGTGLAKSPYVYKEQYDVGDTITIGFSGQEAAVQILSVTENWQYGSYSMDFTFGKPLNNLSRQISLLLNKLQGTTSSSATTDSVKWYTTPTDTEQTESEVVYNTLGFTGSGGTFTLYNDGKTGSKNYWIYVKNLTGTVTLTAGGTTITLASGTYVTSIYVDTDGNIYKRS